MEKSYVYEAVDATGAYIYIAILGYISEIDGKQNSCSKLLYISTRIPFKYFHIKKQCYQ